MLREEAGREGGLIVEGGVYVRGGEGGVVFHARRFLNRRRRGRGCFIVCVCLLILSSMALACERGGAGG